MSLYLEDVVSFKTKKRIYLKAYKKNIECFQRHIFIPYFCGLQTPIGYNV